MNNNMTLKEYLLSQGINSKQEKFERNIRIDDTKFKIKIEKELRNDLLNLNAKEVFILAYKSLVFLKSVSNFCIVYCPKNVVLKGSCSKINNNQFMISIFGKESFTEDNLSNEKNIAIVETIDSNVEVEIL